ncbi:Sugar phosphate isomerase/epimerase [Spirosomataceae bacterium TFI 002]|nr:Sugar phosphate isomerase/epimerase [Spirosomataceae bacterium TFI 002]
MKRRNFLGQIGALGLTASTISILQACGNNQNTEETATSTPIFNEFGLQLWTIKEDLALDSLATLKAVADAGFNYVESFGGDKGIFWGYEAKEFGKILTDLGLKIKASHCSPEYTTDISTEEEFKKLAADAASIGLKYLINPFPGELKTKDEWMKVAEGLNRQGEICKANGIRTAYHNHHIEFLPCESGELPENILIENTDPSLVDFEMDMYWVIKAGQDPVEWLKKHNSRFKLCHVKDLLPNAKLEEIENNETPEGDFWPLGGSCNLGQGQIDFKKLLPLAKENGMEYFIAEQERFDTMPPIQAIVEDAKYMKSFTV